jgi:AraC-like DNA-binding protein
VVRPIRDPRELDGTRTHHQRHAFVAPPADLAAAQVPGLPDGRPDAPTAAALVAWPPSRWSPGDRGTTRVDRLAARCDTGVRRLQRLFAEHVGVGPRWVIRRYRLREVTERLETGDTVDWAGLAAELGHADQAHLSRDVRALFGEPPTHYARRYPGPR